MCIGVSTPPQKYHTLFLTKPPLNLQTLQAPFFRHPPPPPLYIGFLWTPSENLIFQWTPKILKSFILNSILNPFNLLKVTKFLVKISQFDEWTGITNQQTEMINSTKKCNDI